MEPSLEVLCKPESRAEATESAVVGVRVEVEVEVVEKVVVEREEEEMEAVEVIVAVVVEIDERCLSPGPVRIPWRKWWR